MLRHGNYQNIRFREGGDGGFTGLLFMLPGMDTPKKGKSHGGHLPFLFLVLS
jgi:hypothetical protein